MFVIRFVSFPVSKLSLIGFYLHNVEIIILINIEIGFQLFTPKFYNLLWRHRTEF